MSLITVSALYIYPIKSCAGIELTGVRFDTRGPQFDRRYMIIDERGEMVTQRVLPAMSQITPALLPTALALRADGMKELRLPLSQQLGRRVRAVVWKHETQAIDQGEDAAGWLSEYLGRRLRLVRWSEDALRPVSQRHSTREAQTAFSDGYPVLLISEASLQDLNGRLPAPITMNRFRPNVVVRGCDAFAEDTWAEVRIGDVGLDVVKPCERCSITTVDPRTGATGPEPLKTLASYRRQDNKVLFGQNCIHHGPGSLRVGDTVDVLRVHPT